jgi:class 3 adenylate cyclase/CHASE2 domain-containing sensor protein
VMEIKRHLGLVLAVLLGFITAGLTSVLGSPLDGWLEDAVWASQPDPEGAKGIVLVEISDSTLSEWPEPLALMGSRFAKLTDALREAGTKIVVFDFVHSAEPDGLLDSWGSSVLPNSQWADSIDRWPEGVVMGVASAQSGEIMPPSGDILLAGSVAERLGTIDIGVKTAGVNREVALYLRDGSETLPSLPLQAYAAWKSQAAKLVIEKENLPEYLRLGKGCRWPVLRAEKVASGRLGEEEKALLEGSIAVVAMTHSGSRDVHHRPGWETAPGAYIVADTLSLLKSGKSLGALDDWARAALLFTCALALAWASHLARQRAVALGAGCALGAIALTWPTLLTAQFSLPTASVAVVAAVVPLAYALGAGVTGRLEQRDLTELFSQQLSPQVASHLLSSPSARRLGGELAEATVMVFDLRGFTTYSERVGPQGTFQELNRVFGFVLPIVRDHDGIVVTLLGDGFLAVFGAPVATENHASQAISASFAIQRAVREDGGELGFGIGLSTGPLLFGNLGSFERRQFTMISDVVNLASRLQDECKELKAEIVVNADTAEQSGGRWPELSGEAAVKARGRAATVQVRFAPSPGSASAPAGPAPPA